MEKNLYTLHKEIESSWWYRGREEAVIATMTRAGKTKKAAAIDFGAAYGGMKELCERFAEEVDAYEPDSEAREFASTRGYRKTFSNESDALANSYDYIFLFDVLEHIEDDKGFLLRAQNSFTKDGRLVLTVPAYMWLWSPHDVENHHFRRYTKKSLTKLLRENGYVVERATYWNCLLLAPLVALRIFGKSGQEGLKPHPFVDAVLYAVVHFEAMLLKFMSLPFGVSIVLIARRK